MRLLQHCGMPLTDVDFVHGDGKVVNKIFKEGHLRSTLFTGSQKVAEQLVVDLHGKARFSLSLFFVCTYCLLSRVASALDSNDS